MSSTGVPKTHEDILQSTALAFVSTLGPKGEPQTSPVWFGWDGDVLRFSRLSAISILFGGVFSAPMF